MASKKPKLTPEEYAEKDGCYYPWCGISLDGVADVSQPRIRELDTIYQRIRCKTDYGGCGGEWTDRYLLIGYGLFTGDGPGERD